MSADSIPTVTALASSWRDCHAREHFVQFYEHDEVLLQAVSEYVNEGFATGAAAVVVATRAHLDELERRIAQTGVDVTLAREEGRYVPLDAEEPPAGSSAHPRSGPSCRLLILSAVIRNRIQTQVDGDSSVTARPISHFSYAKFHGLASSPVAMRDARIANPSLASSNELWL
jgi:hypothetical protein